jgi:hypothetical protein
MLFDDKIGIGKAPIGEQFSTEALNQISRRDDHENSSNQNVRCATF